MATIINMGGKKKPWAVDYVNGQGKRRRERFKKREDAKKWLAGVEAERLKSREPLTPDWFLKQRQYRDLTVGALCEIFLEDKVAYKEKASARETAEKGLRRITKELGDVKVSRLTPEIIGDFKRRFVKQEGKRMTSFHTYITRLKAVLNWGVQMGHLPGNPIKGLKVENGKPREKEVLSDDDILKFEEKLVAEDPEIRDVFLVGINTMMRLGELYGLTWDMVDLDAREMRLPWQTTKTSESRIVPLNDTVYGVLRRRHLARGESEFVLWHPAYKEKITRRVYALSSRFLGKPHTPHFWRTTGASKALEGKEIVGEDGKTYFVAMDLKVVSQVGGWNPDAQTLVKIYEKVRSKKKQSCVDLIDTGNIQRSVQKLRKTATINR